MSKLTLMNLSALLETFYEISVKTAKSEPPSKEFKKLYFEILKDLDFETVNKNGFEHFKKNKYFPAACDLRNDQKKDDLLEIEAQKSWKTLENVMLDYYYPGFACSLDIIFCKLKEYGREDLKEYVRSYGLEIVNQSNITATRAQFLKTLKARKQDEFIQLGTPQEIKQVAEGVKEMLDKIGNEVTV